MPVGGLFEAGNQLGAFSATASLFRDRVASGRGLIEVADGHGRDATTCHNLPSGRLAHFLIAGTIAVLCTDVDAYVCRHAAMAVDAWNEAAGRPLFEMAEIHPEHGRKVMLKAFFDPHGNCGITKSGAVSVIEVNMLNRRRRCRLLPTLLHELGHSLGLTHDRGPHRNWSVMRDPLATWLLKPSRRDVERLNAIRAGDGAD